jgi:hypothetical protein
MSEMPICPVREIKEFQPECSRRRGEGWIDDEIEGEWETCWQCGGAGGFHDCGEDCCSCLEPELDLNQTCDICGGKGGWIREWESEC